jgi:hypothetical protein
VGAPLPSGQASLRPAAPCRAAPLPPNCLITGVAPARDSGGITVAGNSRRAGQRSKQAERCRRGQRGAESGARQAALLEGPGRPGDLRASPGVSRQRYPRLTSHVAGQPQQPGTGLITPSPRRRARTACSARSGPGYPQHRQRARTAGLRAFSPSFPLTQRHAVYVHNLEADLRPIRRDWVGRSSLKVAGSKSSSRKHPATGRPHRAGADVRYAA